MEIKSVAGFFFFFLAVMNILKDFIVDSWWVVSNTRFRGISKWALGVKFIPGRAGSSRGTDTGFIWGTTKRAEASAASSDK